ncbi:MAG: sulfite exporter TauE/SafE family protein [Elusimicrobia bacterium]|nr:sulfite exporter TauE/SafE family protein [Elusimicrobiota bacterium]
MFFQTAGIEISPWIPPLVAFGISFFTSMGGVSGAFLLLPFQVSILGYTAPSVSATNQLFNIIAIPGGAYRYHKEGRMVWPLTWVIAAGALPGVFIGAFVRVAYLPDPKNFKLFAACVLLYTGVRLIQSLLSKNSDGTNRASGENPFQDIIKAASSEKPGDKAIPAVEVTHFNLRRLGYKFYGKQFDISFPGVFTLSLIVGIIGGIYGIGGGAIIAPFLVTFFGLPVYSIAGAALMGTFITSVAGVASYLAIAPFYPGISVGPDWFLGILFGLGGMGGIYLGARCQKHVPAGAIKWLLAGIITFTALKYLADFCGL